MGKIGVNVIFKDSFPSTNLKVLADCYEKDLGGVVSEICIEKFPYLLFSGEVKKNKDHIATFNLHKEDERKIFFFGTA